MDRKVVVVGAGIVGVSVALALSSRGVAVTVVDRDVGTPRGSTAFAPGFVGLYSDTPILSELARSSAAVYDGAGPSFRRSGGLELATSIVGAAEVERRVAAARAVGLRAELVAPSQIPGSAGLFVDASQVLVAGHFFDDGSADVMALVRHLRERAVHRGARFLSGRQVVEINVRGATVTVGAASGESFDGDDVVIAGGVWGRHLTALTGFDVPLFPVAHPYVYAHPSASWAAAPFVRWPEHHVYSRVHGDRLGIGSYDHPPRATAQRELIEGAGLAWIEAFDSVIESAQRLLRREIRFSPERRVNGVFAMTPDNLPFLGRHPRLENVWVAEGLWITNAAGAAQMVVNAMLDGRAVPAELDPMRFSGCTMSDLRASALRLYRDMHSQIDECETSD